MTLIRNHWQGFTLLGLGFGLWLMVPEARAQYRNNIGGGAYRNNIGAGVAGPAARTAAITSRPNVGRVGNVANVGYGGYAPYGVVSTADPWGGYLTGASNVINAQAQFMVSQQDAMLKKEDVKQAEVKTHRAKFDNWMYERKMTPTLEDMREEDLQQQFQRSRNNPPVTEIYTGKTLNDLMLHITRAHNQGAVGPSIPLDPDTLRHINVSSGANPNGLGVFKAGGKLQWPVALQGSAYAPECKKLEQLAAGAMQQAQKGPVDGATINALNGSVDKLLAQLKGNIAGLSPNEYMASKRYLNELADSVKMLGDANVSHFASGKWAARGNTVAELVFEMSRDGLSFGPATAGDQPFYVSLHRSMVAYDTGVSQLVAHHSGADK